MALYDNNRADTDNLKWQMLWIQLLCQYSDTHSLFANAPRIDTWYIARVASLFKKSLAANAFFGDLDLAAQRPFVKEVLHRMLHLDATPNNPTALPEQFKRAGYKVNQGGAKLLSPELRDLVHEAHEATKNYNEGKGSVSIWNWTKQRPPTAGDVDERYTDNVQWCATRALVWSLLSSDKSRSAKHPGLINPLLDGNTGVPVVDALFVDGPLLDFFYAVVFGPPETAADDVLVRVFQELQVEDDTISNKLSPRGILAWTPKSLTRRNNAAATIGNNATSARKKSPRSASSGNWRRKASPP